MGTTLGEALISAAGALDDWICTVESGNHKVPAARSIEELSADPDVSEALAHGSRLTAVARVAERART